MLNFKEFCTTFCFAINLGLLALPSTQRCMSTAKKQKNALQNTLLSILFYD